jgi:hypothetical protein
MNQQRHLKLKKMRKKKMKLEPNPNLKHHHVRNDNLNQIYKIRYFENCNRLQKKDQNCNHDEKDEERELDENHQHHEKNDIDQPIYTNRSQTKSNKLDDQTTSGDKEGKTKNKRKKEREREREREGRGGVKMN